MTGKTELSLLSFQEALGDLGCMNLVAVVTADRTQRVDPPSELKKVLLFLMAHETWIRTIPGIFVLEGNDEPFSFCLGMLFPGTVAGFAPLLNSRHFWIIETLPVRSIFLERIVEILMASLTGFGSHISFHLRLLLLAKRRETDEGYQSCQDNNHDRQVLTPIHN